MSHVLRIPNCEDDDDLKHKIPSGMHKNSPFPDQKNKKIYGSGHCPFPDPSPGGEEDGPPPHIPHYTPAPRASAP